MEPCAVEGPDPLPPYRWHLPTWTFLRPRPALFCRYTKETDKLAACRLVAVVPVVAIAVTVVAIAVAVVAIAVAVAIAVIAVVAV
jgi:hypothetical protein